MLMNANEKRTFPEWLAQPAIVEARAAHGAVTSVCRSFCRSERSLSISPRSVILISYSREYARAVSTQNAAELETLDGSAGESSSDESEDGETSTTELSQLISPDSQQQMPRTVRSRRRHSNTLHEIWKDIDSNYMKPLFGGSRDDGKSSWQPEQ